jgi:hypothetical protein
MTEQNHTGVAAQPQQAPVAWRTRSFSEPLWEYDDKRMAADDLFRKEEGFEEEPLYAAQPPAAPVETKRCEVCDWPLADSREKGCVQGDCSYRPDDPAEQRRISERRAKLRARSSAGNDAADKALQDLELFIGDVDGSEAAEGGTIDGTEAIEALDILKSVITRAQPQSSGETR